MTPDLVAALATALRWHEHPTGRHGMRVRPDHLTFVTHRDCEATILAHPAVVSALAARDAEAHAAIRDLADALIEASPDLSDRGWADEVRRKHAAAIARALLEEGPPE